MMIDFGPRDRRERPQKEDMYVTWPTLFRSASRDFEVRDSRLPIEGRNLVLSKVFAHVPESATVHRIHGHAGVITPLTGILLVAGPALNQQFCGRGFARQVPPGCADSRMRRRTGNTVTDCGIPVLILRHAGHKTKIRVIGANDAALINRRQTHAMAA